jgi:hypothetical protein
MYSRQVHAGEYLGSFDINMGASNIECHTALTGVEVTDDDEAIGSVALSGYSSTSVNPPAVLPLASASTVWIQNCTLVRVLVDSTEGSMAGTVHIMYWSK